MTDSTIPDMRVIEDADSAPFWDALRAGALELPYCESCTRFFWYPRQFCPKCLGGGIVWKRVSGQATVYSWTALPQRQPDQSVRVIALVELEEGPRLMVEVVGEDRAETRIGDSLLLALDAFNRQEPGTPARPFFRRTVDGA